MSASVLIHCEQAWDEGMCPVYVIPPDAGPATLAEARGTDPVSRARAAAAAQGWTRRRDGADICPRHSGRRP